MKKLVIILLLTLTLPIVLISSSNTVKAMDGYGYGEDFVRYYSVVTNDDNSSFELYYNANDYVDFQSNPLSIQGNDYEIINFLDILNSMIMFWDIVGNMQVDYYINSGKNYTYFANFGGGELTLQSYDFIYISIHRSAFEMPFDIRIIGYNAGEEPFTIYNDQQTTQQIQFYFLDYGIYSHKIIEGTAGYMTGYNRGYSIGYNKGFIDGDLVGYDRGVLVSQPIAYAEGYEAGKIDTFYGKFHIWIVPAIFIVIVVGGFFALRGRREN